MTNFEISKKGLFIFQNNWNQTITKMVSEKAGKYSDFIRIMKECLKPENKFILAASKNYSDYPLFMGVKLSEENQISCKTLLEWKEKFENHDERNNYNSIISDSTKFVKSNFCSYSEYEISIEDFAKELDKIFHLSKQSDSGQQQFIFALFTPYAFEESDEVVTLRVDLFVIYENLNTLKKVEKDIRNPLHKTEQHFFQKEEIIPIMEKLSNLENPFADAVI